METRKSLAIALAVSGLSGQTAAADPATWAGPYIGISAGGGTGSQSQQGGILLLPSPSAAPTSITTTIFSSTNFNNGDGSMDFRERC